MVSLIAPENLKLITSAITELFDAPFDVFPQLVVNIYYQWRENVVSVTCDVIDIKGAVS